MTLLNNCELYFGSKDLYCVLGVSRNASEGELKKAYRKASLLCHPDRVPEDEKEKATKKFQTLSKVHSILSDEEKRAVYDETGCIDEEDSGLEDKDWTNYWKLIFPRITLNDIDNFMKKYRGSKEELEDLKKYYILYEGDMNKISEAFIGYDVNEEEKYMEVLRDLIKKEEIPDFPKFTKETETKKKARVKRFKKEAAEAEKVKDEIDDSLINALMQRSASRESQFNSMMKSLEDKYCKSGGKKKKK